MYSLLILVILAALVFGLGGILPNLLPACALAVVLALAILPLPALPRLTRLWLAGFAMLFWIALTLVPLPAFLNVLAGPARNQAVTRVETTVRDLQALQAAPAAPAKEAASAMASLAAAAEDARPADTCRASLPLPRRFSLNTFGTIRFLMLAAGAWGIFWLAASAGQNGRRRLLKALVFGGAAIAVVGVFAHLHSDLASSLPWQLLQEYGTQGSIWPFVNRNHFATFAAMLAPAALSLAIAPSLDLRSLNAVYGQTPAPLYGPTLAAPLRFLRYNLERLLWLLTFIILVTAVFLSLSRGGTLALITGVLVCIVYWLRGRQIGASTFATILGIAMLLGLLFLPSSDVHQRIDTLRTIAMDKNGLSRMQTWQDSVDLWRQYPWFGAGMDGFRATFPQFRTTPRVSSTLYAESEYVQFFAEGGLAGLILAFILLLFYTRAFAIPARRLDDYTRSFVQRDVFQADRQSRPLKAAVIGAAAVVALHAIFDFPLRVPLNSFLFATLLGLGLPLPAPRRAAASTTPDDDAAIATAAPPPPVEPLWRRGLYRLPAVILALLLLVLTGAYGQASRQLDRYPNLADRPIPELVQALTGAPTLWHAWYELGRQAWSEALPAPPASAPDTRPDNWFAEMSELLPPPAGRRPGQANSQPPASASPIPDPDSFLAEPPMPPSSSSSSPSAETLERQRQWRAFAVDCFYQAAIYNPSDYRPWWTYAQLALANGNARAAERALHHAVRLAPYLAPDAEKLLTQARSQGGNGESRKLK